jgi:anti-anti-sigma factor
MLASTLEMQEIAAEGTRTLMLGGELDIVNGAELEAAVRAVCAEGATRLVIDMSGLAFIDSTGVKTIIAAGKLCSEHGGELCLIPGPRSVQRIFEVTGLDTRLPFSASGV